MLSQSRAGTASLLTEMALLLGIVLSRQKRGRIAAALGAVCLLKLALVSWFATAALWHNFADLQDTMRLAMTKDGLRMFWHNPVLGYGLGTFTTAYPHFPQLLHKFIRQRLPKRQHQRPAPRLKHRLLYPNG